MNVQEIKRYNRRCARREAALLNRNNAVCARMAALSDPPDTGNVEDIALYLKLKAFRAAKATEYTALRTFLNAGPRLRGPTVNFQEWVTTRDQFHAAMEASVQALEAFVAHEEAKQRPSQ